MPQYQCTDQIFRYFASLINLMNIGKLFSSNLLNFNETTGLHPQQNRWKILKKGRNILKKITLGGNHE
jgi:hypothetical protein